MQITAHQVYRIETGRSFSSHPGGSATFTPESGQTIDLKLGDTGEFRAQGSFALSGSANAELEWQKYYATLSRTDLADTLKEPGRISYLPLHRVALTTEGEFDITGLHKGK